MNGLSKELTQRIQEAGKDTAWTQKFRVAATWEECETLLAEKGIEATAELKESIVMGRAGKTGKLGDDELEKVSGGASPSDCPREPSAFYCGLSNCPHCHWGPWIAFDPADRVNYCDLGYWRETY